MSRKGTVPYNKGIKGLYHTSDETKEKIRQIRLGSEFSDESKLKMSLAQLGEKNSYWNGGKTKVSAGYILITKLGHPHITRQGYIFEHRIVMEEFLGRYLELEEVVHHINEIRDDNRIENLMLFANRGEHQKHHRQLQLGKLTA